MTREPFKRGAKVSLAFRRPDIGPNLRAVIAARIKPMVDYFAAELAALIVSRFEVELVRVGEALEVAVSAYASEVATGAPEPTSQPPDPITAALGPELAAMMEPTPPRSAPSSPPKRVRDYKPENYPASRRARPDPTALQANGKQPPTCSKCGQVGANARGCGTAHETINPSSTAWLDAADVPPAPRAKAAPDARPMTGIAPGPRSPAPYEVARAKVRSQERVARLVARAQVVLPRKPEIDSEPEQEDDEDEARWSPERRAEETARAESRKLGGELPIPSSSWEV